MPVDGPLLMIPGPVELSPAVLAAAGKPPAGHTSPELIRLFGSALGRMREIWRAGTGAHPLIVGGSGTLAMELAAANLVEPGDDIVVVSTGFFSDRMTSILKRYGARVTVIGAEPGSTPPLERIRDALDGGSSRPPRALFATYVDTSTGVRLDVEPIARLAAEREVLSIFDGVCASGGERMEMESWGADLVFTASQKALGAPPGLALLVIGPRAMACRADRRSPPPPLYLDWLEWMPIMEAYESGRPSYFATPPTGLVAALETALGEILDAGVEARLAEHARAATAMRAAWRAIGLDLVPVDEERAANTLSAIRVPERIAASVVPSIGRHGVTVAGGLHPALRSTSFRVGHMGWVTGRPELLVRTVEAVQAGLQDAGWTAAPGAARRAAETILGEQSPGRVPASQPR